MRFSALVLIAVLPVSAGELYDSLKNGKLLLDLRARMELVDQGNLDEEAFYPSLRTRLGFETAPLKGWLAMLEIENITALHDDDVNDTVNGEAAFPVVADPEDTEVNQVYLQWADGDHRRLRLGRQRLILDNARFIGNVGWRQNEQTFDAVTYTDGLGQNRARLTLAYVANVNRIFGENHPVPTNANLRSDTFLGNYRMTGLPVGDLTLFAYFIDLDAQPAAAHRDLGLRLDGKREMGAMTWLWDLSYAQQDDYADGAAVIDADYLSAIGGVGVSDVTVKLGHEVLSGDGTYAFQTPLATLHGFNGWADRFLVTPPGGIEDSFLQAVYGKGPLTLVGFYHDFSADTGGDYGNELDLQLTYAFDKHTDIGIKYADYREDGLGPDVTKIMVWGHFSL